MALNMETGKLADVASLDHVNILTNDVEACRQFYIDVLGFEEGFRPDFGFPGLWIYLGGAPVVHFIQSKKQQPLNSGTIDHIAFRAHNYEKFAARLKANKVKFNDQSVPGMDLHQIFCFDPHGIKVEFNFEGQDRPWKTLEKEHKALKKAPPRSTKRATKASTKKKTAVKKAPNKKRSAASNRRSA